MSAASARGAVSAVVSGSFFIVVPTIDCSQAMQFYTALLRTYFSSHDQSACACSLMALPPPLEGGGCVLRRRSDALVCGVDS
jgi:hypothetical protein